MALDNLNCPQFVDFTREETFDINDGADFCFERGVVGEFIDLGFGKANLNLEISKPDQSSSQSNRRRSKSFNAGNKRHDYYKQSMIRSNSTDNINKEQVKVVVVESHEESNNHDENKSTQVEIKSQDLTKTKVKNNTNIKKIIIQDLNPKNLKLNGSKFKKSDSKPGLLFKRIINIIFSSHKNNSTN